MLGTSLRRKIADALRVGITASFCVVTIILAVTLTQAFTFTVITRIGLTLNLQVCCVLKDHLLQE